MYFAARRNLGIADITFTVIISDLSTQRVALGTLCHIESEERTYVALPEAQLVLPAWEGLPT